MTSEDEKAQQQKVINETIESLKDLIDAVEHLDKEALVELRAEVKELLIFAGKAGKRLIEHDTVLVELVPEVQDMKLFLEACKGCESQARRKLEPDLKKLVSKVSDLTKKGKIDKAVSEALAGKGKYGKIPMYWHMMGHVYEDVGRDDKAIESYETAKSLDPLGFESYCYITRLLIRQDRRSEARSQIRDAYHKIPLGQCHNFYWTLSHVYSDGDALAELNDLVQDFVHEEKPYCTDCIAAYLYHEAGEYQTALNYIEKVPENDCTIFPLVEAAVRGHAGQRERALEILDSWTFDIKLNFMESSLLHSSMDLFKFKKECDKVSEFAHKLVDLVDKGEAQEHYGVILERAHHVMYSLDCSDHKHSLKLLEKAREYHDCDALREGLMIELVENKKLKKAKQLAVESLEKYPESPGVLAWSCWVYSEARAVDMLEKAASKALMMEDFRNSLNCMQILADEATEHNIPSCHVVIEALRELVESKHPDRQHILNRYSCSAEGMQKS